MKTLISITACSVLLLFSGGCAGGIRVQEAYVGFYPAFQPVYYSPMMYSSDCEGHIWINYDTY